MQRKFQKIIGEDVLKLLAHNGSGFGSWNFLSNLPIRCKKTDQIKSSEVSTTFETFEGFCGGKENLKRKLHNIILLCSMNLSHGSSMKLGKTYSFQQDTLKLKLEY